MSLPSHPRGRRLLAGFLSVTALLGGLLGEGVHRLLEPHEWCAVHEAVEHGHGDSGEARDERAGSGDELAAGLVAYDGQEDEEHEPCRLTLFSRERAWLGLAPPTRSLAPTAVASVPAPDFRPRPSAVPRVRIAPKQSPPAA